MNVATKSNSEDRQSTAAHKFLIHNKGDHVGVATSDMKAGERVVGVYMDDGSTVEVVSKGDVPLGHKIALIQLEENEPVFKYGIQIGLTTCKWEIGDYVHTHNIKTARW
ncbi:UxaA family hydrolase [Bacillus sp. IB182487]|uniref:UxaA family hydrolase n=2 Tax=Metabacillus arenae TaxID=2771434 RepID=A0A926RXX1_9BACI|nr:UxaA family hydrolase [Metabacillus arenae]